MIVMFQVSYRMKKYSRMTFLSCSHQKIEVTNKSVFDLLSKTTEYLQPNPGKKLKKIHGSYVILLKNVLFNWILQHHLAKWIQYVVYSLFSSIASRAKLNMLNTMSKIRGQVKTTGYPQAEGLLGECMLRCGHELGEDSVFGTYSHIPENSGWGCREGGKTHIISWQLIYGPSVFRNKATSWKTQIHFRGEFVCVTHLCISKTAWLKARTPLHTGTLALTKNKIILAYIKFLLCDFSTN